MYAADANIDDDLPTNFNRFLSNDTININDRHGSMMNMQSRIRSVGTYRQARDAIL